MNENNENYETERELCPQITTSKDIIDRIGVLSIDILNKEKVILQLWENVDNLTKTIASSNESDKILKDANVAFENDIALKDKRIEDLLTSQEEAQQNRVKVEENFRLDAKRLRDENQIRIQNKDDEIQKLQKALDSIEAEAVVNQEEIRKELMEVQNELFSLKESLKSPKKVRKKKKNLSTIIITINSIYPMIMLQFLKK